MFRIPEKKTEIIPPHLPKEVRQKGRGVMFWQTPVTKTLLVAVLFGFFSGLVGGMVMNSRLFDDWLWGPDSYLTNLTRGGERGESRVLAREALAKKARRSLAIFYHQTAPLAKGALPRLEDKIGVGFFVTSDGWLATTEGVAGRFGKKELVVSTADNQVFSVEKMADDPFSDLVLVKVSGGNFDSLPFAASDSLEIGLSLWLPTRDEGLKPTELLLNNYFSPKNRNELYLSSERVYRLGLLKDDFNRAFFGSPVLTTKGEVAGMLFGSSSLLTASLIDSALKSVIKSNEIRRAYLGVHFTETGERGVKLTDDSFRSAPALEKKSPLAGLGLKAGDALLALGDESITTLRPLPDILADYPPGAKVEIKYQRGGQEKTGEVELGTIK